ncbi:MAG: hypothetical protein JSV87_03705 [Candidatus Bathyarchaeota archaeon]|nr:MAG: hypothetical protein JSV87_03705 [Candidatus Bathyarchaeota archaeon]
MTMLIYQPFAFLIWRNRGKKLDHVLTSVDFALVKERKETIECQELERQKGIYESVFAVHCRTQKQYSKFYLSWFEK